MRRRDDDCVVRFLDYVDADRGNHRLAFASGQRVANGSSPTPAVAYFSRALRGRKADKECKDPLVDRAVIAALALPSDDPLVAHAQELAVLCWAALGENLVIRFTSPIGAYRENTCRLLLDKKALSSLSQRQCTHPQTTGGRP